MIGVLASFSAMQAIANGGNAVSLEAGAVKKAAATLVRTVEQSQALFGAKSDAISRLLQVTEEFSADEMTAVNPNAIFVADKFIRALPDGIALPEIAVEPDGSISLDWIQSRKQLFSLSVGNSNRLAYAWLDGTNSGHGVDRFDGNIIPLRILNGIMAIVTNGNPSLRAA